jgi:hypothetical protein
VCCFSLHAPLRGFFTPTSNLSHTILVVFAPPPPHPLHPPPPLLCLSSCGWYNSTIAVYSSPDLERWHLESDNILPVATNATSPYFNQHTAYFEPCVIYSPTARHYALWFLVIQPMCIVTPPCPQMNTKAVAVASSPVGPFEVVSWDVGLPIGSDLYLWTDTTDPANPTTYLKHNGPPPPGETRAAHYVSQLSADLLSVVPGATSPAMMIPALPVPPFFQGDWPTCSEGGGIFSAGGRWFVMGGTCCCFCAQGGNAYVWAADSPLGPYTLLDNEGIVAWNATLGKYVTGAQQFSVAALPTSSGILPMFIGQRFGSADDGLKCHDYQFWAPMHVVNGIPQQIPWIDEWTVEIIVNGPDTDEGN